MHVSSLGFRTDLALLTASGSIVEDRGTHLVVRSPDNPSYFWGNFILLAQPPVPGGEREVVGAFHTDSRWPSTSASASTPPSSATTPEPPSRPPA